jgi:hypothetical protein
MKKDDSFKKNTIRLLVGLNMDLNKPSEIVVLDPAPKPKKPYFTIKKSVTKTEGGITSSTVVMLFPV